MDENKNNGLVVGVIILSLLVVGLMGFIFYDKLLSKSNNNETITNENKSTENNFNQNVNKTFSKNDSVVVNVGNSILENFYVISDNGTNLTLITQNILFEAPFYEYSGKDCIPPQQDGSEDVSGCVVEYDKSTLKTKLMDYTKNWNNITNIRLLSIDEVESNVYSVENRWATHHFYSYNFEKFLLLGNNATGKFWLGSKVDNGNVYVEEIYQNDDDKKTGKYQIRSGSGFVTEASGVRPVISISKEFVK